MKYIKLFEEIDIDNDFDWEEKDPDNNTKEELLNFFNWLEDNGFITGNARPFMDEKGEMKKIKDIVDDYINIKK